MSLVAIFGGGELREGCVVKGWEWIPRMCVVKAKREQICCVFSCFFVFVFAGTERGAGLGWIWCTSCRERNPNVCVGVVLRLLPPLNGFSKVMAGLYKQEKLRNAGLGDAIRMWR